MGSSLSFFYFLFPPSDVYFVLYFHLAHGPFFLCRHFLAPRNKIKRSRRQRAKKGLNFLRRKNIPRPFSMFESGNKNGTSGGRRKSSPISLDSDFTSFHVFRSFYSTAEWRSLHVCVHCVQARVFKLPCSVKALAGQTFHLRTHARTDRFPPPPKSEADDSS